VASSFNQVTLMGNLTRDVEVKYMQNGSAVANIGLAINERFKSGDEWKEKTVFVDVACFGRTAEVAGEYLAKGAPVLISGKLDFQQWEKDGKKNSKLSVICDKLQMIGGKRDGDSTSQVRDDSNDYAQTVPSSRPVTGQPLPPNDDTPF
jgi:single-strand DNA-binding protein